MMPPVPLSSQRISQAVLVVNVLRLHPQGLLVKLSPINLSRLMFMSAYWYPSSSAKVRSYLKTVAMKYATSEGLVVRSQSQSPLMVENWEKVGGHANPSARNAAA